MTAKKVASKAKPAVSPWAQEDPQSDSTMGGIRIRVKPIDWQHLQLVIRGFGEGLLTNPFSEKAKAAIRLKQETQKSAPRVARDSEQLFYDAVYRIPSKGDCYGFPAQNIKDALVSGIAMDDPKLLKKPAQRCVFIEGIGYSPCMVPLIGEPIPDERNVKLMGPGRPADLRVRALFREWEMLVVIRFCMTYIGAEDVLNGMVRAGQMIGLAEWRPDKGGNSLGLFEVFPYEDEEVSA